MRRPPGLAGPSGATLGVGRSQGSLKELGCEARKAALWPLAKDAETRESASTITFIINSSPMKGILRNLIYNAITYCVVIALRMP